MDWKEYRVEPDKGLFEKIERRVAVRRWLRAGGVAAGVLAVAGVALWLTILPVGGDGEAAVPANAVAAAEVPTMATAAPQSESAPADVPAEAALTAPVAVSQAVAEAPAAKADKDTVELPAPLPAAPTALAVAEVPAAAKGMERADAERRVAEAPAARVATVQEAPVQPEDVAVSTKEPVADTVQPHREPVLWAPNIIVPNGDVDENRMFRVRNTSDVSDFSLMIFNRAGRMVYSTNDILQEWDGSYSGGTVPQGAYVWVARFRDSEGVLRQETGTVTVVR